MQTADIAVPSIQVTAWPPSVEDHGIAAVPESENILFFSANSGNSNGRHPRSAKAHLQLLNGSILDILPTWDSQKCQDGQRKPKTALSTTGVKKTKPNLSHRKGSATPLSTSLTGDHKDTHVDPSTKESHEEYSTDIVLQQYVQKIGKSLGKYSEFQSKLVHPRISLSNSISVEASKGHDTLEEKSRSFSSNLPHYATDGTAHNHKNRSVQNPDSKPPAQELISRLKNWGDLSILKDSHRNISSFTLQSQSESHASKKRIHSSPIANKVPLTNPVASSAHRKLSYSMNSDMKEAAMAPTDSMNPVSDADFSSMNRTHRKSSTAATSNAKPNQKDTPSAQRHYHHKEDGQHHQQSNNNATEKQSDIVSQNYEIHGDEKDTHIDGDEAATISNKIQRTFVPTVSKYAVPEGVQLILSHPSEAIQFQRLVSRVSSAAKQSKFNSADTTAPHLNGRCLSANTVNNKSDKPGTSYGNANEVKSDLPEFMKAMIPSKHDITAWFENRFDELVFEQQVKEKCALEDGGPDHWGLADSAPETAWLRRMETRLANLERKNRARIEKARTEKRRNNARERKNRARSSASSTTSTNSNLNSDEEEEEEQEMEIKITHMHVADDKEMNKSDEFSRFQLRKAEFYTAMNKTPFIRTRVDVDIIQDRLRKLPAFRNKEPMMIRELAKVVTLETLVRGEKIDTSLEEYKKCWFIVLSGHLEHYVDSRSLHRNSELRRRSGIFGTGSLLRRRSSNFPVVSFVSPTTVEADEATALKSKTTLMTSSPLESIPLEMKGKRSSSNSIIESFVQLQRQGSVQNDKMPQAHQNHIDNTNMTGSKISESSLSEHHNTSHQSNRSLNKLMHSKEIKQMNIKAHSTASVSSVQDKKFSMTGLPSRSHLGGTTNHSLSSGMKFGPAEVPDLDYNGGIFYGSQERCELIRVNLEEWNRIIRAVTEQDIANKQSVLGRYTFFKSWPSQKLENLARCVKLKSVAPGDVVFNEGDIPCIYFLYFGSCQILKNVLQENGSVARVELGIIKSPDYIGDQEVFGNLDHMTISAFALNETKVAIISKYDFLSRIDSGTQMRFLWNMDPRLNQYSWKQLQNVACAQEHMESWRCYKDWIVAELVQRKRLNH